MLRDEVVLRQVDQQFRLQELERQSRDFKHLTLYGFHLDIKDTKGIYTYIAYMYYI